MRDERCGRECARKRHAGVEQGCAGAGELKDCRCAAEERASYGSCFAGLFDFQHDEATPLERVDDGARGCGFRAAALAAAGRVYDLVLENG
jgi:hypothetical protein